MEEDMCPHKHRPSSKDLLLAAVTSKLEEGNIRAATRSLCSQDYSVLTRENFAAMQEKQPIDTRVENVRLVPNPLSTPSSYQVAESDVARAVRSFIIDSVG